VHIRQLLQQIFGAGSNGRMIRFQGQLCNCLQVTQSRVQSFLEGPESKLVFPLVLYSPLALRPFSKSRTVIFSNMITSRANL